MVDSTLEIGFVTLLKIIAVSVAIIVLVIWLLVKSLFRSHFGMYCRWFEEKVKKEWDEQAAALQEQHSEAVKEFRTHYDELLAGDESMLVENYKHVELLAARIQVMEEMFDRVIRGVMLIDSVATTTKKVKNFFKRF